MTRMNLLRTVAVFWEAGSAPMAISLGVDRVRIHVADVLPQPSPRRMRPAR